MLRAVAESICGTVVTIYTATLIAMPDSRPLVRVETQDAVLGEGIWTEEGIDGEFVSALPDDVYDRLCAALDRAEKKMSVTKLTFLDPEELAYPAGSLRQSRRRFAAVCPDGIVRRGICGIPDTFFSIPARMSAYGKTVKGVLTVKEEILVFVPLGRNNHVFERGSL